MGRGGLRFLTAALVVFVSFVGVAPRASAAPQSPPPKAFILVDAGTGRVLQSGHDHEALPPASLVKLTTALTAIERLPSTALLTVSPLAASQPAMRIGMVAGQKWKFVDVLSTLMIISANDAAYAIAENTSGSVPKFVAAETAMAHRLGMKDSTFADPAGLDDAQSYGGGPRMSAYDIAISARNALAV